jgi:hypothetical protein
LRALRRGRRVATPISDAPSLAAEWICGALGWASSWWERTRPPRQPAPRPR